MHCLTENITVWISSAAAAVTLFGGICAAGTAVIYAAGHSRREHGTRIFVSAMLAAVFLTAALLMFRGLLQDGGFSVPLHGGGISAAAVSSSPDAH